MLFMVKAIIAKIYVYQVFDFQYIYICFSIIEVQIKRNSVEMRYFLYLSIKLEQCRDRLFSLSFH